MIDLTEQNHIEILKSYSPEKWQPLFDLIPEIKSTEVFGTWEGGGTDEDGVIHIPYCVEKSIVSKFRDLVYEIPIMIDFSWAKWDEGRKMVSDKDFDYNTVDIPTKCKIITAIIRNDRFCDGRLVYAFEEGLILRVLKSIEGEVSNS
ncbi:MAG: hypothetical protein JXR53_12780 [Bacteroidales bacterium]|nr:hypothetical protein [Bacteroidales bacterium]